MPLFFLDTPHFVDRKRVFVDSDERIQSESRSQWDATYPIGDFVEKIQAIELVDYNFPRGLYPTFVRDDQNPGGTGNNLVDVRLERTATGDTLDFTVAFPSGRFTNPENILIQATRLFNEAMDATGDPYFNTANNVEFESFTGLGDGTFFLIRARENGVSGTVNTSFLFGTGRNTKNSAWAVLGFQQGVDVFPIDGSETPFPLRGINIAPVSYVDIYVREAEEVGVVSRIFLGGTQSFGTQNNYFFKEPRVLSSDPIRHTSTLTIEVVPEGNLYPISPEFDEVGFDLVFDLILLVPEFSVPCWVKQYFAL